jgi:hypothetical protein
MHIVSGLTMPLFSQKLFSSLYPANTILLRKDKFSVWDRGHTEAWDVDPAIATLSGRVLHDDWNPTKQWVIGQTRYMQCEFGWLRVGRPGLVRWLRLTPPLMPIAVFMYCLFGKGLIINGRAEIFYALQRMVAEAILSLMVLEAKLRDRAGISSSECA